MINQITKSATTNASDVAPVECVVSTMIPHTAHATPRAAMGKRSMCSIRLRRSRRLSVGPSPCSIDWARRSAVASSRVIRSRSWRSNRWIRSRAAEVPSFPSGCGSTSE